MKDIEYDYADVIIGRPQDFKVGRKSFKLYPVTLAKMLLLKRQIGELDIDNDILKANPYMEALRIAKNNKDTCSHILAYHTAPNTYKDLFDTRAITIRKNYFRENLSDEDIASLMVYVLTSDKTEAIIKHLGLDKERERFAKVMEVKKDDSIPEDFEKELLEKIQKITDEKIKKIDEVTAKKNKEIMTI